MSGGGAFGLGKSKSQQSSEATTDSSAYGYSGSQSGDVSASSTTQSIAYDDLYKQLFAGATDAAARGVAGGEELGNSARSLFSGGLNLFDSLGGDAGSDYLKSRLTGDNPELTSQIDQLREDTGRLFNEQLNPAITSRAVAGGTLGGGRQGVAQGLAADAAARSFEQGAVSLRAQDLSMRDAAAMSVAGNSLQAANTGLGALPTLMDTLSKTASPELGIYQQLSSILGGPTVLSTSNSAAEAFSKSFGEQTSASRGVSNSQGTSSSRNFNMSGYGGIG